MKTKNGKLDDSADQLAQLWNLRMQVEEGIAPNDPEFSAKCVRLFHYLTETRSGDRWQCDPGFLIIRNLAGDWQFTLSMPMQRMRLSCLVGTMAEGFAGLEAKLAEGKINWQADTRKRAQRRRNRKSED